MKKLLWIMVLGLLFSGNAYAEDKFVGKWINEKTLKDLSSGFTY